MKIEVRDPMIHHLTLEICWENGWQKKFRRIAQIAQMTYFFESVIFMNLFFLDLTFSGIYFMGYPKKCLGRAPPVMYMSKYTPWG